MELSRDMPDLIHEIKLVAMRNLTSKNRTEDDRLAQKFDHLAKTQSRKYFNEKWVKNISSRDLSRNEINLFGKGLKYSCKNSGKEVINFLANIEDGIEKIKNVTEDEKYVLKQKVASTISRVGDSKQGRLEQGKL